ncbi:MAG: hypothetical protein IT518_11700 [Burkholderiales bacterium]|nr:hypothetical protein [Burkholderiales bacterium]
METGRIAHATLVANARGLSTDRGRSWPARIASGREEENECGEADSRFAHPRPFIGGKSVIDEKSGIEGGIRSGIEGGIRSGIHCFPLGN